MEVALGHGSSANTDPELRVSLLGELCRVLSVVQGIKYRLLPAKFLVLFFPRLVQEPSARCREKP